MQALSKSKFAELLGVSPAYVTKLLQADRLVMTPDGKKVLVEESKARIAATASPDKQGVAEHHQRERALSGSSTLPPDEPQSDEEAGLQFRLARAKREGHLAELAGMEEEARRGNLLDTGKVIRAITALAAETRSALERLPDRLAPLLAAESAADKVYALLDEELGRVLDQLVETAEGLPAKLAEVAP